MKTGNESVNKLFWGDPDMKDRYLNVSPDADRKQAVLFDKWLSAENIPFADSDAAAAYRERVTLIKDAIQLKKTPARIPICPSAGFFPVQYAGVTMHDAMYDYDILTQAWEKYCHDFTPDAYNAPTIIVPGKLLDILDFKLCKWPGRGVSKQQEYQYEDSPRLPLTSSVILSEALLA
jgi:hypothetical protein